MLKVISQSLIYFALVFGVGAICGVVRVPFIQPALGARRAELLEMPIMVLAIWKSANFIMQGCQPHLGQKKVSNQPLMLGMLALTWLVIVELTVTAVLRGGWGGVKRYFTDRDPVAGAAYSLTVMAYALMPWYLGQGGG